MQNLTSDGAQALPRSSSGPTVCGRSIHLYTPIVTTHSHK